MIPPRALTFILVVGSAFGLGCSNNPYPEASDEVKVLYTTYSEAPRTLDPAVSYTTNGHAILANIHETLLEYHYLKRPYELIPGLAEHVPVE